MKHIKRILIALGVVIVIALIAGFSYYKSIDNALDGIHTSKTSASNKIQNGKPFSILLLGADTGADGRTDRGMSDTIIVITVNPKTDKATMYSVPRDTLAEMVGDKKKNVQKINAAYNIGKSTMAKNSISELLNVPIDYSMAVDMNAIKTTVDYVGGIDVDSPMKVSFDGVTIQKGKHHLNGKEALTYARMRYQDPRGDYGRQQRQQQVLKAVVKKLKTPEYLVKLPGLIKKLGVDVNTDLTDKEIRQIPMKYHSVSTDFDTGHLQGKTAWINGSSYQVAPTNNLQDGSDTLRTSLGLSTETISNTETTLNKLNGKFFKNNDDTDYDTNGLNTTYYTNNTH
ncbi:LCP family protein [Companilactobacillus ginsenosidimutans]|uniref:LytR family transcriptional regulator n=1 Tax=Companilactobacillus ginsenosidimutans TaxID=1007676 RepID=A0A0H4QJW6_9LACO|nr:LCP family protein [Companilactobacillus ginsenosidimutans]AKP67351.1 LytR family transcriptional regulator [Companilactobacillus ginsenosidimutans]